MNTDELFIDQSRLPNPLSKQEVYDLICKIKNGDDYALKKMTEHNIKLVLYEVTGRFGLVKYDRKDLVSVGIIGLMKAIKTFNISKNLEFSTYAIKCIDNEILVFLRSLRKEKNIDSLDRIVNEKDNNRLIAGDLVSYEMDVVEKIIIQEKHQLIHQIVIDLPKRDREIIMLHFGFYDDKMYTQDEIAKMLSVSQSYISRLIKKILKKIRHQFQKEMKNYNNKEDKSRVVSDYEINNRIRSKVKSI